MNTIAIQVDTEMLADRPVHTFHNVDDDTVFEILEILRSKGLNHTTIVR